MEAIAILMFPVSTEYQLEVQGGARARELSPFVTS
jgi:hypothetical protein